MNQRRFLLVLNRSKLLNPLLGRLWYIGICHYFEPTTWAECVPKLLFIRRTIKFKIHDGQHQDTCFCFEKTVPRWVSNWLAVCLVQLPHYAATKRHNSIVKSFKCWWDNPNENLDFKTNRLKKSNFIAEDNHLEQCLS